MRRSAQKPRRTRRPKILLLPTSPPNMAGPLAAKKRRRPVSNAGIIAKSQETALASANVPAITIMDAVNDPDIFGPWFRDKQSFAAWFCFLKVIFELPLDSAERQIFQRLTGRKELAALGNLVAALVIGRRGGKSLILALIAAYLACFYDWSPYPTGGESGCIMIVAADKKQGRAIFRYLKPPVSEPRETLKELLDQRARAAARIKDLRILG